MKDVARILFILTGSVSVVLAVLGMFLPVLPTTPFLLLAVFCYGRSSERAHNWLTTNRYFGDYITNYREGRGIPIRQKLVTIAILWLSISYGILFGPQYWWLQAILLTTAVSVSAFLLLWVKTKREIPAQEQEELR